MNRRFLLAAMLSLALSQAAPAVAQQAPAPGIQITDGVLRAMPMAGMPAAGFLTIRSAGGADRLIGFRTPVCNRPELHTHLNDNGIMRMRQVPAIDIPAGGEIRLQPGGLHLMFIEMTKVLSEGDLVPVTLIFEQAGEIDIMLPVRRPGQMN